MSDTRTVILLGADAGSLLTPGVPAFRDLLRRPGLDVPEPLARLARDLGGGDCGGPTAPDALDLLGLIDLDREHRKGHNRVTLAEARRTLIRLGVAADREADAGTPHGADRLAACLGRGDAVVALGPEERMEWALARATTAHWAPADGYGVAFRKQGDDRGWRDTSNTPHSHLRVFKLRGSLGWIHCRGCRALFVAGAKGPAPGEYGAFHPCVHAEEQRERLVVGPARRGSPRSVLGRIRAAAAEMLGRATRVALVGEAPDPSDPFLAWVLRRAALVRRAVPDVLAAGPAAPAAGARLRDMLGGAAEGQDFEGLNALADYLGRPGTLF